MMAATPLALPFLILLLILLLIAGLWDLATFQIPNWLCLAVLGSFLLFAAVAPLALSEVMFRLGVGFGFLVVGMILFARGYLGGGDVKLLAASIVWFGWPTLLLYLVAVTLFGGALAVCLLIFRRLPLPPAWSGRAWLKRLHGRDEGVPYGIAIGLAGLVMVRHLPLT